MRWKMVLILICMQPVRATDVIVVGSGGNQKYQARFTDWGIRLRRVLVEHMGRKPKTVQLFLEERDESVPSQTTSLAALREAFQELAQTHPADEELFVYLIGHGSYLRQHAQFQIPGEDMSAQDLDQYLKPIKARNQVVINGASSSAAFINILSGPNRIICAATKTAREQNATEFMAFFLQGLEENLADQDHDQRISVWEAIRQASSLTRAWYASNRLIATEHAILDDNGDGLGSRLHRDETKKAQSEIHLQDGGLAKQVYLKGFTFPKSAPQQLINTYLAQIEKVKQWVQTHQGPKGKGYYDKLEQHLLEAARLHRRIRQKP